MRLLEVSPGCCKNQEFQMKVENTTNLNAYFWNVKSTTGVNELLF